MGKWTEGEAPAPAGSAANISKCVTLCSLNASLRAQRSNPTLDSPYHRLLRRCAPRNDGGWL